MARPAAKQLPAAAIVGRLATYERLSGIVWMVLAVFQILSCAGVFAGVWNLYAARSRLRLAPRVAARHIEVPKVYEDGVPQLVLLLLVNVFLGGTIGAIWVLFDFYVRAKILENRGAFTD